MSEQPPRWFRDRITAGLQALVVLHLPGGPGADTVAYTRDVWVQTLWDAPIAWDDRLDGPRIEAAFRRLARSIDRWPPPRALLEMLPQRPQPRPLPAPRMSAAERAEASRRLREALDQILRRSPCRAICWRATRCWTTCSSTSTTRRSATPGPSCSLTWWP